MKTIPLISIIVPVFGVESCIEKCAKSLFEQTLENIEIIFVDDCSPDKSIELLKRLLPNKNNIDVQIIRQDYNKGVAEARKTGLSVARGKYIAFCDSDDWVDKDMYHLLYKEAIDKSADVVLCDYYETDGVKHNPIQYSYKSKQVLMSDVLAYRKGGSMCFFIAKKELYENVVFPQKHMWEDLVVSIQVYHFANKIIQFHGHPLYFYLQHANSVSYRLSLEASKDRMYNSGENISLIENFLRRENLLSNFTSEVNLLKYYSKFFISEYTSDEQILKLWRMTYPDVVKKLIIDNNVSLIIKIKAVLLYLGAYPIVKKIAKYFRTIFE